MKVQLLYFPGCPHVEAARAALRRSLVSLRLPEPFEEIDVTAPGTAEGLRSWGSPTILINGVDLAGAASPTGPSCRLYPGAPAGAQGVPDEATISAAIRRALPRRRGVLQSLALLPGALLALLPSATCPACIAAYAGVLSALGLGFVFNERVLAPLIAVLLAVGVASVAWSTRSHRRPGPLAATVAGSAAVVAGRLIWNLPALLYLGIGVLIAAATWNFWLKLPGRERAVRGEPQLVPETNCSCCKRS